VLAPLLLRFGPWLALAVAGLVIWGLWGRLDAASLKLRSTEAALAQKESDARLSAELVARQAEALADLQARTHRHMEKVQHAEITRDCARSPAMRAATRGVRELFGGAGEPAP
jgi:hypothetical protein